MHATCYIGGKSILQSRTSISDFVACSIQQCSTRSPQPLVEEFTENIDEVKITGMVLFKHQCACSYTTYVVLIALTISIGTGASFTYK